MTDISKYKSIAIDHDCYNKIGKLTKILAPKNIKISRAQVVKVLVEEKTENLNGQFSKSNKTR
jgi:sRNA-binding carbon storage regulator CsrA|tara:strand:- start:486 stop:674 length:189 start_codon:yes stop_codon:yes gene_type:complete